MVIKSLRWPFRLQSADFDRTLHELGGLLSASETSFSDAQVPADALAIIIQNLLQKRITGRTAKQLLSIAFDGDTRDINLIIKEQNLELRSLTDHEYEDMAQGLMSSNQEMAEKIRSGGQMGKLQWFVGQMMRQGEGKVEAGKAKATLKRLLELHG